MKELCKDPSLFDGYTPINRNQIFEVNSFPKEGKRFWKDYAPLCYRRGVVPDDCLDMLPFMLKFICK